MGAGRQGNPHSRSRFAFRTAVRKTPGRYHSGPTRPQMRRRSISISAVVSPIPPLHVCRNDPCEPRPEGETHTFFEIVLAVRFVCGYFPLGIEAIKAIVAV